MQKFVLDTNLFFNMEPGLGLGRKTQEVVVVTTAHMKKAKEEKKAEFFMPPAIVREFLSFFEDENQPFIKDFMAVVVSKSPDVSSVQFPASIFYRMVEDIRKRSYRGLNIAEEEMVNMAKLLNSREELGKQELEKTSGLVIKKLRERYRQATRAGFLDSAADLDLIVLARELDAVLVTTDEGVLEWGRVFGVREMDSESFGRLLSHF